MKRSGTADLPLHYGTVPPWLAQRMTKLSGAIAEAIVHEYGTTAFLSRLSDPFWFQSFGALLGMDWHSSGITTSVMGALKKSLNPLSHELGIMVCGGRGKHSRKTPEELMTLSDRIGLKGDELVRASKLTAKIDNSAIQDGFQLYLHTFMVTKEGAWAVVQQGMNNSTGMARRYHWNSAQLTSYVDNPHTSVYGKNQGQILNLVDANAKPCRAGMLEIIAEKPEKVMKEAMKLVLPRHHEVKAENINLKRLGALLAVAHEVYPKDFETLLLLEGVGPRTVQSLALVSEVIHGTPSRFQDPARYSFAHGGKDGHPFPVPLKVYDETIETLKVAVEKSKIGDQDKMKAIQKLSVMSADLEKNFSVNENFEAILQKENENSYLYGGRSVYGLARPPGQVDKNGQYNLF